MNFENGKTSDHHGHSIFRDKINLKDVINTLLYQIIAYTIHGQILESHTKIINLKYQFRLIIKNLNYLIDHILYQIFRIILNIS